jgi:hypothetical protein
MQARCVHRHWAAKQNPVDSIPPPPCFPSPHRAAAEQRAAATADELAAEQKRYAERAERQKAEDAALTQRLAEADRELKALKSASRAAERELVAKQEGVEAALASASADLASARAQLEAAQGRAGDEAAARVEAEKKLNSVGGPRPCCVRVRRRKHRHPAWRGAPHALRSRILRPTACAPLRLQAPLAPGVVGRPPFLSPSAVLPPSDLLPVHAS